MPSTSAHGLLWPESSPIERLSARMLTPACLRPMNQLTAAMMSEPRAVSPLNTSAPISRTPGAVVDTIAATEVPWKSSSSIPSSGAKSGGSSATRQGEGAPGAGHDPNTDRR